MSLTAGILSNNIKIISEYEGTARIGMNRRALSIKRGKVRQTELDINAIKMTMQFAATKDLPKLLEGLDKIKVSYPDRAKEIDEIRALYFKRPKLERSISVPLPKKAPEPKPMMSKEVQHKALMAELRRSTVDMKKLYAELDEKKETKSLVEAFFEKVFPFFARAGALEKPPTPEPADPDFTDVPNPNDVKKVISAKPRPSESKSHAPPFVISPTPMPGDVMDELRAGLAKKFGRVEAKKEA